MKTSTKGFIAAIVFLSSIGIYYYLSMGIDNYWLDYCSKNYCMKTLSLAEFLAIEAALLGVYFVVSSIDDWKKQDQYLNAKQNIEQLYKIESKIKIFKGKALDLHNFSLDTSNIFPRKEHPNPQNTNMYLKYLGIKNSLNIDKLILDTEIDITKKMISLKQKKFENIITIAKDYINKIDKEIKKEDDSLLNQYRIEKTNTDNKLKLIERNIGLMKDERVKEAYKKILDMICKDTLLAPPNYNFDFDDDQKITYQKPKLDDIDKDKVIQIINDENYLYLNFENELKKLQKDLNRFIG